MCHRLKPTEVTSMLLSHDAKFRWEPSKNRIVRFDEFADELAAKFSVVAWDEDTKIANQSKVELFTLCSGPHLRDFINSTVAKQPDILFNDLVKCVRKMLVKCTPPLVQLAKVMANQQGAFESFEPFFNRVHEDAKSICWETLDASNIKNALIATILASNSNNPYVKGHCLSVRDVNSIKLDDIKSTALEYEAKNPLPSTFPSQNSCRYPKPTGSLFGNTMTNAAPSNNATLFGGPHTNSNSHAFGSSAQNDSAPTGFSFGSAVAPSQTSQASFEEQRSGLFGPAPNANTPFGTRSRNIFMSSRPPAPENDASVQSASSLKPELNTVMEEPDLKRQRSESADK